MLSQKTYRIRRKAPIRNGIVHIGQAKVIQQMPHPVSIECLADDGKAIDFFRGVTGYQQLGQRPAQGVAGDEEARWIDFNLLSSLSYLIIEKLCPNKLIRYDI